MATHTDITFLPLRQYSTDIFRASATSCKSVGNSTATRIRGTLLAYTNGRAIAHVPSGNAFAELERFGPDGGYQEVGLAACFIDY